MSDGQYIIMMKSVLIKTSCSKTHTHTLTHSFEFNSQKKKPIITTNKQTKEKPPYYLFKMIIQITEIDDYNAHNSVQFNIFKILIPNE